MNKTTLKRTAICSALLSAVVMVAGCNDDDNSSTNNAGQQQAATETLSGTAATGAPFKDADITVTNKNGQSKTTKTDVNGKFEISIDAGAPYIVKATKGDVSLYSYAAGKGTVNVTQLTTQALLAASQEAIYGDSKTLAEIYSNWANIVSKTSADKISSAINASAKEVVANLKTVFETNGFTATTGYPDIFKTAFEANSTGLDKVLDNVQITGLNGNTACSGTGSVFSCNFQYKVNGQPYEWKYTVDTTGIVIDLKDGNGSSAIPTGNYNLTVTTTAAGVTTPAVTIKNIPKPANQSEFCGSSDVTAKLPDGYTVNSCSFNGTVGTISATVSVQGYGSISYSVKYEYSAA